MTLRTMTLRTMTLRTMTLRTMSFVRGNIVLSMVLFFVVGCNRENTPESAERRGADPLADDQKSISAAEANASGSKRGSRARQAPPNEIQFVEQTERWGVDFAYRNGRETNNFTILESLGGGVACVDYDRDGWPDLFCPGGGTFEGENVVGHPAELFRNLDGERMVAVAVLAGDGFVPRTYNHGAFVADYNADGFSDVLVSGYHGLQLWQNEGDGTFREVFAEAQLNDSQWSSSAGFADFNGDGNLDLYVAHYVNWSFDNHPFCRGRTPDERDICPPRDYDPLKDVLYISNGDGTFRDASEEWGLKNEGKGLGVLIADFDGNGFDDIYVANDTVNNYLYLNSGSPPLREVAMLSGSAADKAGIPNGSMGVDTLDFDRNGRPDIWVTNYEREDFALYRNEGPAAFLHVSDIAGLNVLGGLFVGFGTACADFDLDGDEDIIVNNGHVILFPTASPREQVPIAMANQKGRFFRLSYDDSSYFMQPHEGRGVALGDLDRDGDLDAVFSNINAPLAILENQVPVQRNWLQVELVGTVSNRDAIGAVVNVVSNGERSMRVRKGGCSYLSSHDSKLAWGLGDVATVEQVIVQWPSGKTSELSKVATNQVIRFVEPM